MWKAIVIDDSGTAYADTGVTFTPTPGSPTNPATLDKVAPHFSGEGVLAIPAALTSDYIERALLAGWVGHVPASGVPGAWTTFRRKHSTTDQAIIHVCAVPLLSREATTIGHVLDRDGKLIAFLPTDDPATFARELGHFHATTGVAWRARAGVVGCSMIRRSHPRRVAGWLMPQDWRSPIGNAADLHWDVRKDDPESVDLYRNLRYVHKYDVNSAYLAGAGVAEVSWGTLRNTGKKQYDGRPGYWRIRRLDDPALPIGHGLGWWGAWVLYDDQAADTEPWVTTAQVARLHEFRACPGYEFTDSWTGDATGARVFRGWSSHMFRIITTAPRGTGRREAFKATGNETIGMMARPRGSIFRPDWRDETVTRSIANLTRKVEHVLSERPDATVVRIDTDCVWFATDHPDPVAFMPLAMKGMCGQFRPAGSITMGEFIDG